MSKRNFILLTIILILAVAAVFGFLYFKKPAPDKAGDDPGDTNFFSRFNPYGTKPGPATETPPVDVSGYVPPAEVPQGKLARVSSMPVAGFGLFNKERLKETTPPALPLSGEEDSAPAASGGLEQKKTEVKKPAPPLTEFVTAVRYVEKSTGYIYQTFADKIEERKFSKTLIPKVHEAHFGNRGESVVMRYLKEDERTIETFVGTLPKELLRAETIENEVKGSFLPNNVKDISVSPDGAKIFYLFTGGNSEENIIGATLTFSTGKKTQIFDSPFTEWLSFWPSSNVITLTTKPSYSIPGYMYAINSAGQNLNKILGNINGLTTLGSPRGEKILYGDSSLSLYIYDMDEREISPLALKTIPEKCSWSSEETIYCFVPKGVGFGQYPDSWYQGEVSFDDQLWKIDLTTGNTALLLNPREAGGGEIDGIKLAVDEDENYLFFVNKKDSFLWKLDLK